jgi:predicted nucleotidyltransferase
MSIAVSDSDEDPLERLLSERGKKGAAHTTGEELLQKVEELRQSVESRTAAIRHESESEARRRGRRAVENKQEVLALLREHRGELKNSGVARLGLFGSFLRNEQRAESDVDLLVEFAPGQKNFDNLMRVGDYLESLFARKVELVTPESLSSYLRPRISQEAEYVVIGD